MLRADVATGGPLLGEAQDSAILCPGNRCGRSQQDHLPVRVTAPEAEPGSAWLGESTILARLPPLALGESVREPDPLGVFDPPALHVSSGVPLGELTARV